MKEEDYRWKRTKKDGIGCIFVEGKWVGRNKCIGYCKAKKAEKPKIWKVGARTRTAISLINIYLDSSYKYGIMMQDYSSHSRHTDCTKLKL